MTNSSVLVLNQNYEPLNVCNARRAFILVDRGKAEVLEHGGANLRSATRVYPRPSVIRLIYLIKRPRPQMRAATRMPSTPAAVAAAVEIQSFASDGTSIGTPP